MSTSYHEMLHAERGHEPQSLTEVEFFCWCTNLWNHYWKLSYPRTNLGFVLLLVWMMPSRSSKIVFTSLWNGRSECCVQVWICGRPLIVLSTMPCLKLWGCKGFRMHISNFYLHGIMIRADWYEEDNFQSNAVWDKETFQAHCYLMLASNMRWKNGNFVFNIADFIVVMNC